MTARKPMNPIRVILPNLPDGCEVYNFMYRTRDPEYLVQDQLSVRLQNGFVVDVSWFPEHDPNGCYHIHVIREFWDNQFIDPIESANVNTVVARVQSLAQRFDEEAVPTGTLA